MLDYFMRMLLLLASSAMRASLVLWTVTASAQQYDIVLEGGHVMDPETGVDAVRNVGIRDGRIARISPEALSGRHVVHAGGLIVAPGFIDLHQHGQDLESQRVKALDGVTTALELEIGAPDVAQFLVAKQGHSLIHYGTAASHVAARSLAFGVPLPAGAILPKSGPATDQPATPEQIEGMRERLRSELDAGGLAIGMGIEYTPGATRLEVIDMFRLAAERKLPVYTHVRSSGLPRARLLCRIHQRSHRRRRDQRRIFAHCAHQQLLRARLVGVSVHDRRSARSRP